MDESVHCGQAGELSVFPLATYAIDLRDHSRRSHVSWRLIYRAERIRGHRIVNNFRRLFINVNVSISAGRISFASRPLAINESRITYGVDPW